MLASVGHRDSGSSTREGLSRSGATLIECRMAGQPPTASASPTRSAGLADVVSTVSTNKKALADQSRREPRSTSNHRGSRTAHHPKNRIDPFEQCPSRALLGSQAPTRGAAGCRVTENAGRAECSDAQTRLLKKSEAGLPHANLSGGSCMHALQIGERDGHKTHSNGCSLGIRFYWPSYPRPPDFQVNSSSDF
jgi:hypothetical protein